MLQSKGSQRVGQDSATKLNQGLPHGGDLFLKTALVSFQL